MEGKYGLLGRNISYSFSRGYFGNKFEREGIAATYENFDIPDISYFQSILEQNPDLKGLNVTIPYKEQVLPFLTDLDPTAAKIGAVNTIKVLPNGDLKGFNTDYFVFSEALKPFLKPFHGKALILGTGGASKAIYYALNELQILPVFVSRSPQTGHLKYEDLDEKVMEEHLVIVNCTPLGTSPNTEAFPPIPIDLIGNRHFIFDLIYNPAETKLMELASKRGAVVSNGLKMLELQAEKSWLHWH